MPIMTREEKLEILSRVARMASPSSAISFSFQRIIVSEDGSKGFASLLNVAIKAIAEANKMEGHLAPSKLEIDDCKEIDTKIRATALKALSDKNEQIK